MNKNTLATGKNQPALNTRTTSSQSGKDSKSSTQSAQDKTVKPVDSKSMMRLIFRNRRR
jgi:hypothetical protein